MNSGENFLSYSNNFIIVFIINWLRVIISCHLEQFHASIEKK